MKKFLLLFSTILMLMVCLCVPAFAADECLHSEYIDGCCSVCGHICAHEDVWCDSYCWRCGEYVGHDYVSGSAGSHFCSICGRDFPCTYDNGCCLVCSQPCPHSRFVSNLGGTHHCVLCSSQLRCSFDTGACPDCGFDPTYFSCVCPDKEHASLAYELIHEDSDSCTLTYSLRGDCLSCGGGFFYVETSAPFFSALGYTFEPLVTLERFTWNGIDCLCGTELLTLMEMFAGSESLPVTFRFLNDSLFAFADGVSKPLPADFLFDQVLCSDNISLVDLGADEWDKEFIHEMLGYAPSDNDPYLLRLISSVAWSNGAFSVTFDPSTLSVDVLSIVTSGVDSAAAWVSTFAITIATTPILLVSAILAFIGFGIGILKRIRT